MTSIKRPSLGWTASLGTLYDARNDTFIPISLLKGEPPAEAVKRQYCHSSEVKMSRSDTYGERFNTLNVGADLSASFLAGLLVVGGSGGYLTEKRSTNLVMQPSLLSKITTVSEVLKAADSVKACLALESLDLDMATHVVSEITWGACNIVTAKHMRTILEDDNSKQIEGRLNAQFKALKALICSGEPQDARLGQCHDWDDAFEVTVYGDILANDGLVPNDFKSASQFLTNVPKYIAATNDGKGVPVVYTLLPLHYVSKWLKIEVPRETTRRITIKNLSEECTETFVQLFDELHSAQQKLNDYAGFIRANTDYLPRQHLLEVHSQELEGRALEAKLKSKFASTLKAVRSGKADDQELWQLLKDFRTGKFAVHQISVDTRPYTAKVNLIQGLVDRGAEYIGFNGESLDIAIARSPSVDTYVLYFSGEATLGSTEWSSTFSFVNKLLDIKDLDVRVLLKDCDAFNERLTTSRISLVRNAQIIEDDVLKELKEPKLTAEDCIMRYNDADLDRSGMPKPQNRIPVRIPCPGLNCKPKQNQDWVCFTCGSVVEYGVADKFFYCDCGRCHHRLWGFKCNNAHHGLDFENYNSRKLSQRLASLKPPEELNILILGPTGVGKSTWINAFANYLVFNSLDESLKADKLCWVIPFSFRTYTQKDGRFETINVRVGFEDEGGVPAGQSSTRKVGVSEDEHDGSTGASATQRTKVHLVQIGDLLVRLIDTPGIGDTRGPSQDDENMADILKVLRQYDKLHGILILLKPNDQRLTIVFRFCIQELLTHLHRQAAKNIAFGFTNTRGTNYQPGDTFDPLHQLLSEHKEVEIGLFPHNVYCFDSESFRYLAAFKQHGQELGDTEENRRSWNKSVSESWRLLDYFKTLEPHKVQSTLNLSETRHQIEKLTVPMAEIDDAIEGSIRVNQDHIKELGCTTMKKKDLEGKLRIEISMVLLDKIDQPRTTCSHNGCVENCPVGIEGGDGKPILKTVHTTLCHAPCYLEGVTVSMIGHSDLQHCAAMKDGTCQICGHPWKIHLHVKYDVRRGSKKINDPGIEDALKRNASARELQQKGIKAKEILIQKLRTEQEKIKDAAARFSNFLKRNSIIYYNDATLKYLDFRMEQEESKVRAGGSRDKLENLKRYRCEYEQQVKVLDEYRKKGEHHKLLDQRGAEKLLKKLRSLELYGDSVKRALDADAEEVMVYREDPHVIRAKSPFTTKASQTNAGAGQAWGGMFLTGLPAWNRHAPS